MEQIISKCGQTWNVIESWRHKDKQLHYRVSCSSCGYKREGRKYDLRIRTTCPGCETQKKKASTSQDKPKAVKLDDAGTCVSICEIGTVEFVREYQERHGVSEREAVTVFIESAKAHLMEDDPIQDKLTPESIRAKVRRATGKKDNPEPKRHEQGSLPQSNRKFQIEPTPESVTAFIKKHLPSYTLTKV